MTKNQNDAAPAENQAQATPPSKTGKRDQAVSPDTQGGLMARLVAFKEYVQLSRVELRKVSWPTWKETRTTSLVVLAFVAAMAILLGVVDLILSSLVRLILA